MAGEVITLKVQQRDVATMTFNEMHAEFKDLAAQLAIVTLRRHNLQKAMEPFENNKRARAIVERIPKGDRLAVLAELNARSK